MKLQQKIALVITIIFFTVIIIYLGYIAISECIGMGLEQALNKS